MAEVVLPEPPLPKKVTNLVEWSSSDDAVVARAPCRLLRIDNPELGFRDNADDSNKGEEAISPETQLH